MSSYLDAIAALGKGSLHPGGFSHTIKMLKNLIISPEDVILDIGCGTGQTACYLAKNYGAHVFALDNSEKMLAGAKIRAFQEGADVRFVLGDALDMPFRDEVADLVIIESVLIFLPVRAVLKECFRVLKRKGVLVDVEMLAGESLPADAREQVMAVCGLPQIPSFEDWLEHFNEAGFAHVLVNQCKLPGFWENLKEMFYSDSRRIISYELMTDRRLHHILRQYRLLIMRNKRHLGFGTFILRKN